MKVAEQCDRKALKTLGPASQRKILSHDQRAVGLKRRGIYTESDCSGSCRESNKRPPVYGKWSQSVRSLTLLDLALSDVQDAAYRECYIRDT